MGVHFSSSGTEVSTKMKFLIVVSLLLAPSNVSHQFYASKQAPAPPQPVCRQVPKEVCSQVPKTTFESVTRQQCRDVRGENLSDLPETRPGTGSEKRMFCPDQEPMFHGQ